MGKAIADFSMIEEGDKVMACRSGGKDSYTMLECRATSNGAPVNFAILAVNLDQKQPDFPEHVLPEYLEEQGRGISHCRGRHVFDRARPRSGGKARFARFAHAFAAESSTRRLLKRAARRSRSAIMPTILSRLLCSICSIVGQLKAMPPILRSDAGTNTVIRPLAYCQEKDIAKFSAEMDFPIIPCNLCGSQPNMKRARGKNFVTTWKRRSRLSAAR